MGRGAGGHPGGDDPVLVGHGQVRHRAVGAPEPDAPFGPARVMPRVGRRDGQRAVGARDRDREPGRRSSAPAVNAQRQQRAAGQPAVQRHLARHAVGDELSGLRHGDPVMPVGQHGRDIGERPGHPLESGERVTSHDGQHIVAASGIGAVGERPRDPAAAQGIARRDHADRLDLADPAGGEQVGGEPGARGVIGLQAGLGQVDAQRPFRVHVLARRQRGPDPPGVSRRFHAHHHQVHLGIGRQLIRAGESMRYPERVSGRPGAVQAGRGHGGHRQLVEVRERREVRGRRPALGTGADDSHPYPFRHLIAS